MGLEGETIPYAEGLHKTATSGLTPGRPDEAL